MEPRDKSTHADKVLHFLSELFVVVVVIGFLFFRYVAPEQVNFASREPAWARESKIVSVERSADRRVDALASAPLSFGQGLKNLSNGSLVDLYRVLLGF